MASDTIYNIAQNRGSTTTHGGWANSIMENFHELPAADKSGFGIWCYADQLSYKPGETIKIHTCTTLSEFDLRIYRDGAVEELVHQANAVIGVFHETPSDCSVNGCGWPVTIEVPVTPDWRSGGYVIHVKGRDPTRGEIDHHFPVTIRAATPSAPDAILLIAATGTWVAYNDWGGSNFYEGIVGPDRNQFSPVVSTLRPFSRGFAWLPKGAPRAVLSEPPPMGAAVRYPHMEWAYANGFSKKYASAGWATYERNMLHWAEANGFTVDMATQHDLHSDPDLLSGYRCVVFVGHDEYWSWEMRDAVERYAEAGGHVARFGANFIWQIRIQKDGTQQVCYKGQAKDDPIRDTDRSHLLTAGWEDVDVNRPGALTFGLNGGGGILAGWGGCVPRGSGGFSVYRPDHWSFEGTDLYYGDQLGAASKIFGYEVDGCDYVIRNGLPYATGKDGAPENMEIVALGLATAEEPDHGNPGSTLFNSDESARNVAYRRLRRTDPAAIDSLKRGSGMIVFFDRGRGKICNAATCEWVAGLMKRDPFVERFTMNVLKRFTSKNA